MHLLRDDKKGPDLLFLHGFLGTSADWLALISHLPPSRCLGVDLPGHGESPFTPTFDLPDLPAPIHLVGYSMGGRLALQWAAANPSRVKSLTLLSTHPGLESDEARRKKWEEDSAWADLLLQLPIDEFLTRWYDQPLFYPFRPPLAMRRKQAIEPLRRALLHYSSAKLPLAAFEKALCAVGERDSRYRSLLPQAIVIPEAGHAIHLENPQRVAQLLKERIFS